MAAVQQIGDVLDRLPEAHVVGQAGAQAALGQEGQPAYAALLVRPELPDETRRSSQGRRMCRATRVAIAPTQQLGYPALSVDREDRQAVNRFAPERQREGLAGR